MLRIIYLLGTSGGLGIVGLDERGQSLIGLGLGTDVTREGVGGGLTGEKAGDGIDVANVDLDGSVILGGQQTVGPAALAGDVEVDVVTVLVLHGCLFIGVCMIHKKRWKEIYDIRYESEAWK